MSFKKIEDELSLLLREKSIFSLGFNPLDLEAVILKKYFRYIENGEVLAEEGAMPTSVIIPLTVEISLISKKQEQLNVGTVSAGRIFNFYSVLRKLGYQYSSLSTNAGWVFEIPIEKFFNFLNKYPRHSVYLKGMTGSSAIRNISSQFNSIECNPDLKIDFISRLVFDRLEPQAILQMEDQLYIRRRTKFKVWQIPNNFL